jgi:DNA repair protein SbcC/Rad50
VTAKLQRLVSSRRLPQWLADAALDTLVADTPSSPLGCRTPVRPDLHCGDFYFIDRADAN